MRYFSLLPLLGLAAAAPLNDKRDVVVQDVVITQFVTTTIWIDPADPTPAAFFEKNSRSSASVPASSSSAAPSSSSTPPPAASPTPTPAPSPAAVAAPAAAAPAAAIQTGIGQLTFYNVGMGIGSCGMPQASSGEHVVAVAAPNMQRSYQGNPNSNPLCGKTITITCNGVTASGTVYDTCPECPEGNLDLSTGFFDLFGAQSAGRLNGASWIIS